MFLRIVDVILGIVLIFIGFELINYYQNIKKAKKTGGLSFKFQTAGIGLIIIGISLLFKSCNQSY